MKNKILQILLAIGVAFAVGACSTVTIREKGTGRISTEPNYEDSKPYFFWGLAGEHEVDVRKVCDGKKAIQMQAQSTFVDRLLAFLTIGIYYPRTAKVWCAETKSQASFKKPAEGNS